ncbi:MAG: hypothetical protein R3Y26_04930 [Rikenellaceae bacterium]
MKSKLAILFTISSLFIFFCIEKDSCDVYCHNETKHYFVEDLDQSFLLADNIEDSDNRETPSKISVTPRLTKRVPSRQNTSRLLTWERVITVNFNYKCSCSHNYEFPLENQQQKRLFYLLRNIRV